MDKPALRQSMRQARRALSETRQQQAAAAVAQRVNNWADFQRARHIAFYIANDGEVSLDAVVALAEEEGKQCFLPALKPDKSLEFRHYRRGQVLATNQYGIPEPPATSEVLFAHHLDLVFMPLVAFDQHGGRLGMGGGYYDRTFAFKQRDPQSGPLLAGVAHSVQQADQLPTDDWDIPLGAVVTDSHIFQFR